jgi:microcin C transport system permease protein
MTAYFLRRLLLIPITFVAITFLVYAVQRLTPGGPIEQARMQMLGAASESGAGAGSVTDTGELKIPEEALKQLQKYYKLDRSIPVGYLIWLGAWPDDDKGGRFSGILQGDFGMSYRYNEPVLDTITSKFPVSLYFGIIGYLASWIVCIPLGVQKALTHRSTFDTASSMVVFLGYSIPGFVASLLLLLLFATDLVGLGFLPLGGFRSPNWDDMWAKGEWWWCVKDQVEHTIIPLIGYMLGSFATMTILMKNSLLENLGSDYVRTAFAKGLPERRVVFVHAMRNSLIPLLVGIGHALGVLFAGSFLIEKTCNINGFGLLGFTSLLERDYPVLMGILVFLEVIGLFGNLISDVILALVDPRVRFK